MGKKHWTKESIEQLEKHYKINLINSVSGARTDFLIGTKGEKENLAIFNSIVHIGSDPALIGFILRPTTVKRDSYQNLLQNPLFTLNGVNKFITQKAHFTAFQFEDSEFDAVALTPEYKGNFDAPFCEEAQLQIGLRFIEEKELSNGCRLIVGQVEHLFVDDAAIKEDGILDIEAINLSSVLGLNTYYQSTEAVQYPFPREENLPLFEKKKSADRADNVVFDQETEEYTAALMRYSTNIGAPSIVTEDLTTWKALGSNKVNHLVNFKFEKLKGELEDLMELFKWNELIYNSKFDFEPIVGKNYHLYEGKTGEKFLSQIPPEEWNRKLIASFLFDEERVFRKM